MLSRLLLLLAGALAAPDEPPEILWLANNALANEDVVSLASGLQYRILRSGPADGPHPTPSSPCECHYKGTLTDGTEFDSSYRRGKPSTFTPNRVVPGWTEALQLMRPGDKWELFVPPHLGYGNRGSPPRIPPRAVLIFTLELISIGATSKWTFFGFDFSQPSTIAVAVALGYMLMRLFFGGGGAKGPRVSVEEASGESNPRVFFDMSIGGEKAGRIEMELFSKVLLAYPHSLTPSHTLTHARNPRRAPD
jgi:FKBP-type peptidyl-prolyl cis-trans isomerase FklB